ncbi:sensor domain-containing protein [Kitasatospora cinereorecta]
MGAGGAVRPDSQEHAVAATSQFGGPGGGRAGKPSLTEGMGVRLQQSFVAAGRAAAVLTGAFAGVFVPGLVTVLAVLFVSKQYWYVDALPLLGLLTAVLVGVPTALWCARRSARLTRSQVGRWSGVALEPGYMPRQALEQDDRGHWWTGYSYHRDQTVARLFGYVHWAVRDRATRNEAAWLAANPVVAGSLLGPPMVLMVGGAGFLLTMGVDERTYGALSSENPLGYFFSTLLGGTALLAGLLAMPYAVRAHGDVACRVLGRGVRPSHAQLSRRVEELTVTRADAVDAQAAELRRIERDLHDGAQARLVAIGLTLGTIEHLMETDQPAARVLLAEARQSSAQALQELRDLVRGIHPPVLAERGLADAVRELALRSAVPTEVTVSLPGRPEAPMEAAAYFSVSELLANAGKHSGAEQVWVDIMFRAGLLRVTVTDDGRGGAHFEGGGGLLGIERRLGTFDGVLSLSSPPGGPTTITMELPCALSSPRISTSSEKG